MKTKLILVASFFLCVAFIPVPFSVAVPVPPMPDIPESHLNGFINTGWYAWSYSYDLSLTNRQVLVDLGIKLVGDNPGNDLKMQWEKGIESIWSNKYWVVDGNFFYPILINADWVDSNPDYMVTVHSGTGRTDMLNWYTDNPAGWSNDYQDEIAAHEAGHMFGLYDEYPGGALNPVTKLIATHALMADFGPVQERYFEGILAWLEGKSGRDLFLSASSPVQAVPEPATLLLLGLGLVGLAGLARRKL